MKKFNIQNYLRYKDDLETSVERVLNSKEEEFPDETWPREDVIIYFMDLVEQIARSFSTSDQASGVMDITDLGTYEKVKYGANHSNLYGGTKHG